MLRRVKQHNYVTWNCRRKNRVCSWS